MKNEMIPPHLTLVDYVDIAGAVGLAATPLWMPEEALHLHLEVASCTFGCIYIIVKTLITVDAWWRARPNRNDPS